MLRRHHSKVASLSGSPASGIKSSGTWTSGRRLRKGREEGNETNLHDKSTSLEPTLLAKAVSYTKEGKQRNEMNLDDESGPRRQGRQLYEEVQRKERDKHNGKKRSCITRKGIKRLASVPDSLC